jgi:flavin reductase (DIM6/NTAB) family NADH-FMN oxidoreductase RutF
MLIDISQTSALDVYRLLISVVTPRPIAWVTSVDGEGHVNLAPFSFFNVFGAEPPVVVFAPNRKRDGSKKDTLNNAQTTGQFVVNAAVADLAEQVNLSSKELPAGQSEVDLTGLSVLPSIKVRPPRLAESPVNLECVVREILPIGGGPFSANLVIGEVVMIHVAERVLDERGRVDPRKLRTIARLGGDFYCQTSDLFQMKRPE